MNAMRAPMLERPVDPGLMNMIAGMSLPDQATLRGILDRVQQDPLRPATLDPIGIIHRYIKNESEALPWEIDETTTVAAAMVKPYPDRPVTPLPREFTPMSDPLDRVLRARASRRDYGDTPIALADLSSLLYHTYGIRKHVTAYSQRDFPVRWSPSAGGLQSAEIYLIVNRVDGVPQGLHHYNPIDHSLELLNRGNMRRAIVNCCMFQDFLQSAGVVVILTSVLERLIWKYGPRGYRHAHLDVGFVGQNLYLVTTALKLRTCAVAGFREDAVNSLLEIDGRNEFAVLLFPVGTRPTMDAPVL
ncbi:MAG: SagB/ThcOx family dehydrogenase [Candidatus Dormibacteraeota bacterium]|nr:SagB/ThcOx family dehydrogenase [Candidatus Dormibacteraeota bacterium]